MGGLVRVGGIVGRVGTVNQVEQQVSFLTGWKGVAVHADALGGRELGQDAAAEFDGVVAGLGLLVGVIERRAIAGFGLALVAGHQLHFAHARNQQDIHHVGAAGAAQVGVAKTHDGRVGVVVTGAPVPALVVGVRAELDGTEGHSRSGKGMTVAAGADKDVDVLGHVTGGCLRASAGFVALGMQAGGRNG